ncbi:unnamed protein product [marine sediment metagenome]|uniref:Uncharacterized protein n=1 Tax=marine sediment metagenome TaxID=412755 RepID=X1Q106_9ZZZZ
MPTELDQLISYWKDTLAQHRLLMSPSVIYLVEQTIKRLEELKKIKESK